MDHQIWKMLKKWYSPPTTIVGVQVTISKGNWNENKMNNDSINTKTVVPLVYSLSFD